MRRLIVMALVCVAGAAQAQIATSNVQLVRGWRRTHVMGLPGGGLQDPTGTLADGQRMAAVEEALAASTQLVAAAEAGYSNAMERLQGVLDNTNRFSGRVYLAADMDSDPGYGNIEAMVVGERTDGDDILYYVHYTRLLETPPRTLWRFAVSEEESVDVDGVIEDPALTNFNGYACYEVRVPRPGRIGPVTLRAHRFLRWGAPGGSLTIPDDGLELAAGGATSRAFTGSVHYTNGTTETVEVYLSGFLWQTKTNAVEVL